MLLVEKEYAGTKGIVVLRTMPLFHKAYWLLRQVCHAGQ